MQAGDIVFFRNGVPRYSKPIQFGQRILLDAADAEWTHVGIATGRSTGLFINHVEQFEIVEMLDNGVNPSWPGKRDWVHLSIDTSDEDREQIAAFLHCMLEEKRPYGYITIASLITMLWVEVIFARVFKRRPRRWLALHLGGTSICSGAAADALTRAGYIFEREPYTMMPGELHKMLRLGVKDYRQLD